MIHVSRFDNIHSREQFERDVSEGGMSMGAGRRLEPLLIEGSDYYGPCAGSPDGMHHYVAISNIQSVEHFKCAHCPANWYD